MGHLTTRDAYRDLTDRLNWSPQGAAPTETLFQILQVMFTEEEAKQVSQLPVRPFNLKRAAKIWGISELEAEKRLDHLCEKGLMVDSSVESERRFVMPPPMIGFFEFALMRTRGDIDQRYLAELFHQYVHVEEDFIKDLFFGMETKLGRVLVQEPVLLTEKANHILDYERATHLIEEAKYVGVGLCYCRHKQLHLGNECAIGAPLETCLTFDNIARSLADHGGYSRLIDKSEAKEILAMSYEHNLVQMAENVRENPAFLCNCCGCCCEALGAAKRFSPMQPIETSNYIPKLSVEGCVGCGKCEKVCPIDAISMRELAEPAGSITAEAAENASDGPAGNAPFKTAEAVRAARARARRMPVIDESICLGCGVCARNCPKKTIILQRRPQQVVTPVNTTHRFVLEAIEKGTLQNLIFDNRAFANHRAMAAVFGTILKLPPLKQALASRQFKSVYLDSLLARQKKEIR